MRRALITGIAGQDGLYLAELLVTKGYQVFGLIRGTIGPKHDLIRKILPDVRLLTGDIRDPISLRTAIEVSQPQEVYNLAAISFIASSWDDPSQTTDVTAKGVVNLLEAMRSHASDDFNDIKYYQASSSEMFGKVLASPQDESTAFKPRSPYAVAKVFAHQTTVNYRENYGLHASNGVLFNHESPRRGTEFVSRKISQGVARISLGLQSVIPLGNLEARRDWGYAGDYAAAMWQMVQQPNGDDFVIATGQTHSIRDLLDTAFDAVGISDWSPYVTIDPRYFRPTEPHQLVGNARKAENILGWKPLVSFHELVHMMVKNDLKQQSAGNLPIKKSIAFS